MGWDDGERIRWYGERGIVNAIVTHIASGSGYVQEVRALLGAVEWANGERASWISDLVDARIVVEAGFGDFGAPDLMLVCQVRGEEQPTCVFVEAKATPYWMSMADNAQGMSAGYNSSINGQLALKYRLATALAHSPHSAKEVVEPTALHDQYRARLMDPSKGPRHVRKGRTLDLLRQLGLVGTAEDRFRYVALTWDSARGHVFFRDPQMVKPDNLPLFLSADGSDQFPSMGSQIGWLGYGALAGALALDLDPAYQAAFHTMMASSEPSDGHYEASPSWPDLPSSIQSLTDEIVASIRAAAPPRGWAFAKLARGWSIGPRAKTMVKVMPEPKCVFVGLQDLGDGRLDISDLPTPRRVNGYQFHGVTLTPVAHDLGATGPLSPILRLIQDEDWLDQ